MSNLVWDDELGTYVHKDQLKFPFSNDKEVVTVDEMCAIMAAEKQAQDKNFQQFMFPDLYEGDGSIKEEFMDRFRKPDMRPKQEVEETILDANGWRKS